MKKLLLVAVCLFAAFTTASAQDFVQGSKVLSLGVGLGNTIHSGGGYSTSIPPLSAALEFCVKDNLFDDKSSIGVGGYFGYVGSSYKDHYFGSNFKVNYSNIVLAARGALHYQFVDKLDTYVGLGLGYDIASSSVKNGGSSSYSATGSAFFVGGYLGGRYYFSEKFGVMAEVGYDVAVLTLGVSIKL